MAASLLSQSQPLLPLKASQSNVQRDMNHQSKLLFKIPQQQALSAMSFFCNFSNIL